MKRQDMLNKTGGMLLGGIVALIIFMAVYYSVVG